jgi:16S rRNA processing protein RimM
VPTSTSLTNPDLTNPDRWVPIAIVAKPHGVRGETKLRVFNDESELLLELDEVLLRLPSGEEHEVSIDAARRIPDGILVKFYSVDDRERAESIRNAELCARRSHFPELEAGEFYACDVVGAAAYVGAEKVGIIDDYRSYPSVDIFVLRTETCLYEVPVVDAYFDKVDGDRVLLRTLDELEPSPLRRKEVAKEPEPGEPS